MRSVYRTVVVKKELSRKAEALDLPLDTSGRNEFPPQGWLGAPLEIGVRSSVTREELGVEPLLLHASRGVS
ncbi:hypothetical protein L3Q82_021293 [Scortum barcoo]|uniref:Uncharacterized protein n=1 Tax=Scortum barcoo TaxID=214431 RepID=A0ACB8X345_9TELE|nr:hypothetical protein L3Q82_021293 [Scortum barcoo]